MLQKQNRLKGHDYLKRCCVVLAPFSLLVCGKEEVRWIFCLESCNPKAIPISPEVVSTDKRLLNNLAFAGLYPSTRWNVPQESIIESYLQLWNTQ